MILFKNEIINKVIGGIVLHIQQPNNKQRIDISKILVSDSEYKWVEAAEYVFTHVIKDIDDLFDSNGNKVNYHEVAPSDLAMGLSNVINIVEAVLETTRVPDDIKKN